MNANDDDNTEFPYGKPYGAVQDPGGDDLALGDAARLAGDLAQAAACYRQVLQHHPDLFAAWLNLAAVTLAQGQPAAALPSYDRALVLRPQDKIARTGRAMAHLTLGHWAEGWADYAWRLGPPERTANLWNRPRWRGEPGKRVLLFAEQGLGDTLMFARFAAALRAVGCSPILACQPALVPLLSNLQPALPVIALSAPTLPGFDMHLPLLDLPGLLGITASTLSPNSGYLRADQARVELWRRTLAGDSRLRVGIAWQGNPKAGIDKGRSFPLVVAAPLAALPNVRLIALQRLHGLEQIATLPEHMVVHVPDETFDAGPGAFADTAAMLASLDLLITSDSAIAHVAGALGCPTWVALQAVPDWRWGLQGAFTPWYSSLRLFRQTQPGDWGGVFGSMAKALA